MFFAPYSGSHRTSISIEGHCGDSISARHLYRSHVESKDITVALGAPYMEGCIALQTRRTGTVGCLADFAQCIVPQCRRTDSFHHVKSSRVAESDLWMPKRAVHMDPVVVCSTLEGFTWNIRSPLFYLLQVVLMLLLVNELFLQSLLFSISIRLLLVCDFGLLVKVVVCVFVGT